MSDKRHFKIVEGNKEQGLFVGRTPSSVAKKVVSKLSKGNKVVFSLREITHGSKKKTYGPYEGYKKKLKEPRKVGDRVYKYESVVRKIEKKGGGSNIEIVRIFPFLVNKIKEIVLTKHIPFFGNDKYSLSIDNQPLIKEVDINTFKNIIIKNENDFYNFDILNKILTEIENKTARTLTNSSLSQEEKEKFKKNYLEIYSAMNYLYNYRLAEKKIKNEAERKRREIEN